MVGGGKISGGQGRILDGSRERGGGGSKKIREV